VGTLLATTSAELATRSSTSTRDPATAAQSTSAAAAAAFGRPPHRSNRSEGSPRQLRGGGSPGAEVFGSGHGSGHGFESDLGQQLAVRPRAAARSGSPTVELRGGPVTSHKLKHVHIPGAFCPACQVSAVKPMQGRSDRPHLHSVQPGSRVGVHGSPLAPPKLLPLMRPYVLRS
jgi:hypothetical protein